MDASVNLKSSKAICRIIIGDENEKVEFQIRLLALDPEGTTTGKMISIAVGLQVIRKANLRKSVIIIFNDS